MAVVVEVLDEGEGQCPHASHDGGKQHRKKDNKKRSFHSMPQAARPVLFSRFYEGLGGVATQIFRETD